MSVRAHPARRRGFSLLELVMVVVIIGVIGAIAIPRLSRGAGGAEESALARDLQVLRNAIDHYWAEHGSTYPTAAGIEGQLTRYSDLAGTTLGDKPDPSNGVIYGPYLRRLPPVPTGPNKGAMKVSHKAADGVGWIYDEKLGTIEANLSDSGSLEAEPSGDPLVSP